MSKKDPANCPCCGEKAERIDKCIQGISLWQIRCTKCGIQTHWADIMDWGDNLWTVWDNRTHKE